MLSTFPLCIKGWLDISDLKNEDLSLEYWKSTGNTQTLNWSSKFCLLMENDSKLYIFNNESRAEELRIPSHLAQCRLDMELNTLNSDYANCCCVEDGFVESSKTSQSDRKSSNRTFNQGNYVKAASRNAFFRSGCRFFRAAKSNIKPSASRIIPLANSQSMKSASNLKRTLSLSRLNRKKSDDKSDFRILANKKNMCPLSQSTGDLTLDSESSSTLRITLSNNTAISEIHTSLVGDRQYCFSISGFIDEISDDATFGKRPTNTAYGTRCFAAQSYLERECWIKRLNQTLKPNMENENRINNSLKLTIFELKSLPTQKRKYYCDVSLDKNPCAKTTSKWSNKDGSIFWAEDIVLNNLSNFKTLTISLYKELEPVKDIRRKKRKHQGQCAGQLVINLSTLDSKNELQSWFNLRSSDILPELISNGAIQIRVKIRYQSLKVLKVETYNQLHEIATKHYTELIQFLEKHIPIKLKEEIAVCLVNIHEKNGTIIQFLTNIISEEISDFTSDNCSMVLRANTIVTKIIETHMKLVGSQYIHDILHPFIHEIMSKDISIEVDPSRVDTIGDKKDNLVIESQKTLIRYLKGIVHKIYESRNENFPGQLKAVFIEWRQKILSKYSESADAEDISIYCDVIISGCIFLRLLCPAILSPHLFGLISHFSDQTSVQRTLTLIAKSLQSLANFSKFGEKERCMLFLNSCVEEEIPYIHDFLRDISTKYLLKEDGISDSLYKEIHYYGACIDLSVELARLHNCLVCKDVQEHMDYCSNFQNVIKLPTIIREISRQLTTFTKTQSTTSFFTFKKSQVANMINPDQGRTSTSSFPSMSITELVRINSDHSSTRLGSPVLHTPLDGTGFEYSIYDDSERQQRSLANIPLKYVKPTSNLSTVYCSNAGYDVSNISKSQLPMPIPTHTDFNFPQRDFLEVKQSSRKIYPLQQKFCNLIISENHFKPPVTTSEQSKNRFHLSKCSEARMNICEADVELQDRDVYVGNHIYGIPNIKDVTVSTTNTENLCRSKLDKYFVVRKEKKILEKFKLSGDDHSHAHLQYVCKEMTDIGVKPQSDQLKDFNKRDMRNNDPSAQRSARINVYNSRKSVEEKSTGTDIFDDVLKSVEAEGYGLKESQVYLGRYVKKKRPQMKLQSAPHIYSQESPSLSVNSATSDPVFQSTHADLLTFTSRVINSADVVNSSPSSNYSSLMSDFV